jgi:O-antigen/teichoic acid export membrane protein
MGLQRQVLLNAIRVCAATLQAGGAAMVLWLVSPTIQAYFFWQVLVAGLHTAVVGLALWKSLPAPTRAAFRGRLLASNWRFAGGLTGITVLVVILAQLDKVVLSRLLSLEMFGYYSLAAVVAGALTYISGPIFSALFPLLTQAAGNGDTAQLASLYHKGSQLMAALVSPIWITLALFSEELLSLWLGDPTTVANTHLLVSLLATGTALNALLTLPYALQLSHGWTALSLYKNLVSVAIFVPLLLWLIGRYGAPGAALAWILLNVGYLLFEVPLMHRRLLSQSMPRWYLVDVGLPVVLCLIIGGIVRLAAPSAPPAYAVPLWILLALSMCFVGVALAMPHTRVWARQFLGQCGP